MMTPLKFITAAALLTAGCASAQTAGTWMVRAGATTIAPQVTSGFLSAPDFKGGTQTDVSADTQPSAGITYMITDQVSVDLPLAPPFRHKIVGDGAIRGTGDIGEVQSLPLTIFVQYRFLGAQARLRPYVGLGATYAYFFNEQGSGKLTALSNPGGPPTRLRVDAQLILTPQIGATLALGERWFVDVHYSRAKLSTTTRLSTGQTLDAALDPVSYGVAIGYRF